MENSAITEKDINEMSFEVDLKLQKDANGDYKRKIHDDLLSLQREAQIEMDKGLPMEQAAEHEQVINGIKAAQNVLNTLWDRYHA